MTDLRIRIVTAGRDEAQLKNHRIEQLEKRIAQLEYFAAATRALKISLVESLVATKAASRVLGEEHKGPNA